MCQYELFAACQYKERSLYAACETTYTCYEFYERPEEEKKRKNHYPLFIEKKIDVFFDNSQEVIIFRTQT